MEQGKAERWCEREPIRPAIGYAQFANLIYQISPDGRNDIVFDILTS